MQPAIIRSKSLTEALTSEHCYIYENCVVTTGDHDVSVARARVKPGVATKAHHLEGTKEIYLIAKGEGRVCVGNMQPCEVREGDVVIIPAGTSQKIVNTGKTDLIFYCICTPSFSQDRYRDEET